MKKTSKNYSKKKSGKKSCFRKFIGFILIVTGIGIAAGKIIEKIRTAKYNKANETSDIKHYFGFLNALRFPHPGQYIAGLVGDLVLGAYNVDVSGCDLKEDAFISLSVCASAVRILVPENVNVIVDGLYNKSAVVNSTDSDNNADAPKLYIALKANYSAVKIERVSAE